MAEAPAEGWSDTAVIPYRSNHMADDWGTYSFYLKRSNGTHAAIILQLHSRSNWNRDHPELSKTNVCLYYLGGYVNPTGSRNLEYFEAYNKMMAKQRRDAVRHEEKHKRFSAMAKDLDYYRYFKLPSEKFIIEWMQKEGLPIPPPRTFEQIEREDPALAEEIFQNMSPEQQKDVLIRRKAAEAAKPTATTQPPAKP